MTCLTRSADLLANALLRLIVALKRARPSAP